MEAPGRIRLGSSGRNLVLLERYALGDSIPDPGRTAYWWSFDYRISADLNGRFRRRSCCNTSVNTPPLRVWWKVFTSKSGNTFLNFGAAYPDQTFTGWLPAGTPLASDPAIQSLQGKKVKITGTIELYRGKPEIKILSSDQITGE